MTRAAVPVGVLVTISCCMVMGLPLILPRNVTDLIERLSRRSGITFTAHTLRHTYATELLRRKVPAEVVQKLLGHASVTTTLGTYEHLKIEDIRRTLLQAGWLSEGGQR